MTHFKKLTALFLSIVLCISCFLIPSSARSSLYISTYSAWLTAGSLCSISVTVDVSAYGYMDEVGASRIEILESDDDGETWETVRVYLKSKYPEMVNTDAWYYYDTPVTYTGIRGREYTAIVTIYAGDSTGYDTREYTTPMVTAHK